MAVVFLKKNADRESRDQNDLKPKSISLENEIFLKQILM